MVEEKFTIKNSDGKKIAGKIFAPQIDGKKYPTVIVKKIISLSICGIFGTV